MFTVAQIIGLNTIIALVLGFIVGLAIYSRRVTIVILIISFIFTIILLISDTLVNQPLDAVTATLTGINIVYLWVFNIFAFYFGLFIGKTIIKSMN